MNRATDPRYLRKQYGDASNLNARIGLHARFSTNPLGFQRWVFDLLRLSADSRVLEVGCGPGSLWVSNHERIPDGWHLLLTDFSPGMVEQARLNLAAASIEAGYANADAQALPLGDGLFDAVIANHMLYHVPNRGKALLEIKRVLKPGGRLYASTVGRAHMIELSDLLHTFNPRAPRLWNSLMEGFIIENGQEQLEEYFDAVTFHRYENTLIVTEAAPLVEYARSTGVGQYFDKEQLTRFVEDRLATDGAISIRSDTGMFEAKKG